MKVNKQNGRVKEFYIHDFIEGYTITLCGIAFSLRYLITPMPPSTSNWQEMKVSVSYGDVENQPIGVLEIKDRLLDIHKSREGARRLMRKLFLRYCVGRYRSLFIGSYERKLDARTL